MQSIAISNKRIGNGHPVYIIAEMSANHNRDFDKAIRIIEAAKDAGADAIKLQTYTPDTMTLDITEGEFLIEDPESLWKNNSLYELYKKAYTPWDWHKPIFQKCKELGLTVFSTPFDESAVDFLEDLDTPAYKIASFENTDIPLIRKVASTGKPVILSTGMATVAELDESIGEIRKAGCRDIILLKCTSTYPASPEDTNLFTLPHMRELFKAQVGLSDHTMGIGAAIAGIALGAVVIEKHFTLNRADGGVDSAFSMEPDELCMLVKESKRAWQALGRIQYGASEKEEASMVFKRSVYVCRDMEKGEAFSGKNIRIIRPGFGLPPKNYELLLGKRANKALKKGTPVSWNFIG